MYLSLKHDDDRSELSHKAAVEIVEVLILSSRASQKMHRTVTHWATPARALYTFYNGSFNEEFYQS